uniref:Tc1-like transposase DDE domain-containing protein n=1 Tax=Eptatretus burgeri TaxID=7764 RepID=A0A8C4QME5_EPTBU
MEKGGVMVWGCFAGDTVVDIFRIQGTLNQHSHHSILLRYAIPSGVCLVGLSFVFQQDNDPKHTSRLCKGYLTKKESDGVLHQMTWPPQSPDLNPIEMVWDELDCRMKERKPTSAQHMCADEVFHRLSFNGSHSMGLAFPSFLNSVGDDEVWARMLLEGAGFVTLDNETEHSTLACCALTLKLTSKELGLNTILLAPNEISVTTCLPCLPTHRDIAAWCVDGPKLQVSMVFQVNQFIVGLGTAHLLHNHIQDHNFDFVF